ncbi:MAG TPA: 3'-5' exonuclease [Myxococcota bacterium]|nr:3'-5' exonuclease [Myxococcota bacterium]
MRGELDRARERGEPVGVVELARQLLSLSGAIDPALARRVVGAALERAPQSLPDLLCASDLRPGVDAELADRALEVVDFAVVDLETTGLDAEAESILEIGAVRVSRLAIVDRFETLLRPAGRLPRAIVALTGICDAMVAQAPTQRAALRAFSRWLARAPDAPFVAHNAAFDHRFASRALDWAGLPAHRGVVLCSCKLARRLLPELGRYGLDPLCAHFGISNRARHRALGDAEATARAWIDLLEVARSRYGMRTLGDLIDCQRRPAAKWRRRAAPRAPSGSVVG